MKRLIIPDIHERIDTLTSLLPIMEEADEVIFLGDWFDTFGQGRAAETAHFLAENINTPNWIFLLGNHDCHYFFKHPYFRCSGYSASKQTLIDSVVTADVRQRFGISYEADGYLMSHAGFTPDTHYLLSEQMHTHALVSAHSGGFHEIFNAGRARGGRAATGGPTWLDWNQEFEPLPGLKQIIGHTHGHSVRVKDDNYCIDTGLKHVAWLEDGTVTLDQVA